jgi:hypothetical protein
MLRQYEFMNKGKYMLKLIQKLPLIFMQVTHVRVTDVESTSWTIIPSIFAIFTAHWAGHQAGHWTGHWAWHWAGHCQWAGRGTGSAGTGPGSVTGPPARAGTGPKADKGLDGGAADDSDGPGGRWRGAGLAEVQEEMRERLYPPSTERLYPPSTERRRRCGSWRADQRGRAVKSSTRAVCGTRPAQDQRQVLKAEAARQALRRRSDAPSATGTGEARGRHVRVICMYTRTHV